MGPDISCYQFNQRVFFSSQIFLLSDFFSSKTQKQRCFYLVCDWNSELEKKFSLKQLRRQFFVQNLVTLSVFSSLTWQKTGLIRLTNILFHSRAAGFCSNIPGSLKSSCCFNRSLVDTTQQLSLIGLPPNVCDTFIHVGKGIEPV